MHHCNRQAVHVLQIRIPAVNLSVSTQTPQNDSEPLVLQLNWLQTPPRFFSPQDDVDVPKPTFTEGEAEHAV